MTEGLATFVRIVLMGGTILATLVFAYQTVRAWRHLSYGQKMFAVGVVCILIYVIDVSRAALEAGLTWNWRLAPLGVGLASLAAYLMEPLGLKSQRFGRPDELSGPPRDSDAT